MECYKVIPAPRQIVGVLCSVLAMTGCITGLGCVAAPSTLDITDYRSDGPPQTYREVFPDAYFDLDAAGNVNLVLRRSEVSHEAPGTRITQVVHLRSVWRPIPGVTVAERTQINGTVTYSIISGSLGATFEGAGSIFFELDNDKQRLEGSLDLATLIPVRRLAASGDFFEKAELSGRFVASRDGRRVARIVNDMNRRFGPRTRVK